MTAEASHASSTATGLSATPEEYLERLGEQPDERIDGWAAELMRDVSIRRGVLRVIEGFMQAAQLSEREFERTFAAGGGAPAVVGRTSDGRVMVPAVSLHHLVSGIRSQTPDGRERLISYIAANFEEIVYI
jgi:hypothetical protein